MAESVLVEPRALTHVGKSGPAIQTSWPLTPFSKPSRTKYNSHKSLYNEFIVENLLPMQISTGINGLKITYGTLHTRSLVCTSQHGRRHWLLPPANDKSMEERRSASTSCQAHTYPSYLAYSQHCQALNQTPHPVHYKYDYHYILLPTQTRGIYRWQQRIHPSILKICSFSNAPFTWI